jgi:hypothetical protein
MRRLDVQPNDDSFPPFPGHPHQRPRGCGDDFARAPTGAPTYGRVGSRAHWCNTERQKTRHLVPGFLFAVIPAMDWSGPRTRDGKQPSMADFPQKH